jgi:Outer membrane protein and related peptidoglycan-associated (lipo)proteins
MRRPFRKIGRRFFGSWLTNWTILVNFQEVGNKLKIIAAILFLFLSQLLPLESWGCMPPRIDEVIHFKSGSAKIRPESLPILENVVSIIKANPGAWKEIIIEGNSDDRESPRTSIGLSVQRAQAILEYLSKSEIKVTLRLEGYGDAHPVASNDSDEGRAKNRRVEFKGVYPPKSKKPPCIPTKKVECPPVAEC